MRTNYLLALYAAAFVAMATPALPQGTTQTLQIKLEPCKPDAKIYAILQGRDWSRFPAERVDDKGCRWRVNTQPERFNTALNHFSVRLEGEGRSRCQKASWNEETQEALLKISPAIPVQQITIEPATIEPGAQPRIAYQREMPNAERGAVPCTESSGLPDDRTHWTINDVNLGIETLRVRYPGAPDVCGLVVNNILFVREAARRKGIPIVVDRPLLVDALTAQGNGGGKCYPPLVSPAAISILEKRLARQSVPTLSIRTE